MAYYRGMAGGTEPAPPPHPPTRGLSVSAEVTQLQDVIAEMTRRVKALEDKAVMAETASRRAALDHDRVRERLVEFESQTQQAVVELTKGADRAHHRLEQTQRDVEGAKDWCHKLMTSHIGQVENALRSDLGTQMGDVARRAAEGHNALTSQLAQLEQNLKVTQDSARASHRELQDRIDAVAEVVENGISEASKRSDLIETQFHEALEVGLSRERAAREREVLDRDRQIQQAQANTLQIVERELGAEVKRTSEFAETSLQRMDAIERLLKAEIRNRMDLSSSYDKMVDDMRKMERTTLASVTALESAIQEKFTEASQALQQQGSAHRDALSALSESQKKALVQLAASTQKDLTDSKAYVLKKFETCEKSVSEVSARLHEAALRVDEIERQASDARHTHAREGEEHRSMLTRAVNKWEDELGRVRLDGEDFCLKQQQAASKEAVNREALLKDQLQAEVKRVADSTHATLRSHEKTHNDLKRTVTDSSADNLRELRSNMDKVATLVSKTDEISKLHMDKNAEVAKEMNDLRIAQNNINSDVAEFRSIFKKEMDGAAAKADHQYSTVNSTVSEVRKEVSQVSETMGEQRLTHSKSFNKINEHLLTLQNFHETQQEYNSQTKGHVQEAEAELLTLGKKVTRQEAEAQRLAGLLEAITHDALEAGDRNAGSTTKLVAELDSMNDRTVAVESVLDRLQTDLLNLQQERVKTDNDTSLLLGMIDELKAETAETGDKASGTTAKVQRDLDTLKERSERAEEQLQELTNKQQTLQRTLAKRKTSEEFEKEVEAVKSRTITTIQHRELKQEVEELVASFAVQRNAHEMHTKRIDTLHEKLSTVDVYVQERVAEIQKDSQTRQQTMESDISRLRVETQHSVQSAGETRRSIDVDEVRQELQKVKGGAVMREELDVLATKVVTVDKEVASEAAAHRDRIGAMLQIVEEASRQHIVCEEGMRFRSFLLEFDVKELGDRVRVDFEAYEKLVLYHEKEAQMMAQRRGSRTNSQGDANAAS
eukprot:TRINITY_DN18361_c0_g1_i1.p1 TRINITY_DN18361_c0_g1~~TRINITY_DN18361_c0_g1_i1.p1  ORF type:complete len:1082 (+),score=429.24 TRINITY_DN18361_c0_g1_i1:233-3247(+)